VWGRADAPVESNNLRVYISETAFASSATAYADLAANSGEEPVSTWWTTVEAGWWAASLPT